MNKKKIESDMASMKRLIANPSIPQEVKDDAEKTLAELTAQLQEAEGEAKEGDDEPAPKKRKTRSDKGAGKGKKKAAAAPAKKKKSKPEERIMVKTDDGERDIKDISAEDCLKAYYKRRESAKKSAKKRKSKSLFTRLSESLSHAAETAIKAVPKEDIKENPVASLKAFEKIADIFEIALKQIKDALKPIVDSADLKESAEAKKDMESLDKLIADLKKKYGKEKKEDGGIIDTVHRAEAA